MNIFKMIWNKLKVYFIKRFLSLEEFIDEAKVVLGEEDDPEKLLSAYIKSSNEQKSLRVRIAKYNTSKTIINIASKYKHSTGVKRRKILTGFEVLRIDLQKLEEQRILFKHSLAQIIFLNNPNIASIDEKITSLKILIEDTSQLKQLRIPPDITFEKLTRGLDNLLSDNSTLNKHKIREHKSQEEERLRKVQIHKRLSNLEKLIEQNEFIKSKELIDSFIQTIIPQDQITYSRFSTAKAIYEEKLLKRETEVKKKRLEEQETQRIKEIEERRQYIERGTPYSKIIQGITFSSNSVITLGSNEGLYENLNRGLSLLKGDKELKQYIYSYGKMHLAKLRDAFNLVISPEYFDWPNNSIITIIDWGCGQALGSITLIEQLERLSHHYTQIDKIILIEPSKDALKRACLHASLAVKSDEKIYPVNVFIGPKITNDDLKTDKQAIKIHVFSNIIDVHEVDIELIKELILNSQKGVNYIIVVGPKFSDYRDNKMDLFANSFNSCNDFKSISDKDTIIVRPNATPWQRKERIIKINI